MSWIDDISISIGAIGLILAGNFYYHLWQWARDCQSAVVAVAYKRKVVMSPTLVELLLWSRQVPEEQNGQVFYKAPNVTIAIVKRNKRTWQQRWEIRKNIRGPRMRSRFGSWSIRDDTQK